MDTAMLFDDKYEAMTEAEIADEFDILIKRMGLFKAVHAEVWGACVGVKTGKIRADRLLIPGPRLIDAGWKGGVAVVEFKKDSRQSTGRWIAQLLDYMRGVYDIGLGFKVVPGCGFLFPYKLAGGAEASVLAQNACGAISHEIYDFPGQDRTDHINFKMEGGTLLYYDFINDKIKKTRAQPMPGKKVGSR